MIWIQGGLDCSIMHFKMSDFLRSYLSISSKASGKADQKE